MSSFREEQLNQRENHCCINHEFLKAATIKPKKIAAVHSPPSPSDGAAQISRQLIKASTSSYSTPPVYDGDQCFTFADVLKSVEYLTSRLRCILGGADNSRLIMPQSTSGKGNHGEKSTANVSEPSISYKNLYRPKILGIYMPPSVEYIVSVLSVLRCGEAFLPLDPSWPKDRILSILYSSDVDLVITSASSFSKAGYYELNERNWLVEFDICAVLSFSMEESLEKHVGPLHLVWPCQKDKKRLFCYLMYTSGSTGKPKGVCGTEEGLLNRFLWMQELYPLSGNEVLLFKTSISFIDHLQEVLSAMLTACTLVIPNFNELRKYPFSVANFLQAYSISRLIAVPSLMRTILPALQSQDKVEIQSSLELLVLSGEVLPLSLWDVLSNLLPKTSILNLYGSTEVSGDCTYFDCKRLPMIPETEALTSVPIGMPISNCDVILVGETDVPNEGEICVSGLCVSCGFSSQSSIMPFDCVKVHENIICSCLMDDCGSQVYYRTGDFARRLQCGDLVFLGRTDRTVKVNGQRIALEEIENTFRGHPDVLDAAVISHQGQEELLHLEAFLVLKEEDRSGNPVRSIRSWMVNKLPLAIIPNRFVFMKSLPISSSGKVDYSVLASSSLFPMHVQDKIGNFSATGLLHIVKQAFCDALMAEDVSDDDNFFMMGGSSITAAQVSYNLGIDMRLLYNFPTPSKLYNALLYGRKSDNADVRTDTKWNSNLKAPSWNMPVVSATPNFSLKSDKQPAKKLHQKSDYNAALSKRYKVNLDEHVSSKCITHSDGHPWSLFMPISCSFSRCNKVMCDRECKLMDSYQSTWSADFLRKRKGSSMQELWKVHMESCVDASPLIVFKDQDVYLFIGSHAHKFVCVNAKSGSIQWEVRLQGRIESSAAIVAEFSQVVVGCYEGKIYFLDFLNGKICWTFQTEAEVKCQPVVDIRRQLIWCGSHDHYLYALDYRNHCCIYKLSCGGSIFGSPAIDEVRDLLYVASTSGRLTAISIKVPFHTLWQHELEVPIFGSLSVGSPHGNVICCLVDGNIVAVDSGGSVIWRCKTGGPIFAGACISRMLPSQVLVCSRNGSVYSFEMEKGDILWEYNVGDAITSSAYVDEHLQLVSDSSLASDRLICVCASSGSMHLLRINLDIGGKENQSSKHVVEEVGSLDLLGDIFSSPVMLGGRIFVGCRDDYVHCISLESHCSGEE